MIPLFKVFMSKDATKDLSPVLESGYIGQGSKVDEFEAHMGSFTFSDYCASVNSGTSAIHLGLHLIKTSKEAEGLYKPEVLTTPLTCTATNFAIMSNGLHPKWVDVDPNTCNIDYADLKKKISHKTLAIVVVHWGGYPCDLDKIKEVQDFCEEKYGYRPPVVEDCAHALGARYDGKHLGNHGNFAAFSFQAIKHLTTGDGGMLISPNKEQHKRAKLTRWYGLDRELSPDMRCDQNVQEWGYKFHMNDISAQIGLSNIKHLRGNILKHIENGSFLDNALDGLDGVKLLEREENRQSSYWIYTMRVDNRPDFERHMKDCGIHASRVHDRNDKHKCLESFTSDLPGTTEICEDMISIPCGWWISESDREHIVKSIEKGW